MIDELQSINNKYNKIKTVIIPNKYIIYLNTAHFIIFLY